MSFITMPNMDDIPDMTCLPAGEYELQCVSSETKDSAATPGNRYIELKFKVLNHDEAWPIKDRIHLISGNEPSDKKANKKQALVTRAQAFNIDLLHGFDDQEFVGKTVWALLKITPAEGEFPEKNEVARYVKGA